VAPVPGDPQTAIEALSREMAELRAVTAEEDLELRARLLAVEEQVSSLLERIGPPTGEGASATRPASKQERKAKSRTRGTSESKTNARKAVKLAKLKAMSEEERLELRRKKTATRDSQPIAPAQHSKGRETG
jgi:hypothetical protein